MVCLVRINLNKLKDKGQEIGSYLEEKLRVSSKFESGKFILIENDNDIRMKDLKTYLKKYIYREGLKNEIRILIHNREVNLKSIEKKEI